MLFFWLFYSISTIYCADPEDKLSTIQSQIKSNQRLLAPKRKEKEKAIMELGKINRDIQYNSSKIVKIQSELEKSIEKEKKSKHDLRKKEKQFQEINDQFTKRIIAIYKLSPIGVLDILLSNDNWVLNSEQSYFFSKLLKEDAELIEKVKAQHRSLEKKRKSLIKQTANSLALKHDLEESKEKLIYQNIKQKRHISKIDQEIATLLEQNRQLEQLSEELSALIKKAEVGSEYYAHGKYILPVNGWISSRFGLRTHPIFKRKIQHNGIDIAAPKGYKIRASNSGIVIFSGAKGGYGNSILIYHGKRPEDGKSVSTFYAHQSKLLVQKGDRVSKGDEIGWVGSTGFSTGPHLHFEVKVDGIQVDPLLFVPSR